jgi:threonine dehydrogenase-like Zn-dependent dehydrogenase
LRTGEFRWSHRVPLDRIVEAYDLVADQRDGVLKVAMTP